MIREVAAGPGRRLTRFAARRSQRVGRCAVVRLERGPAAGGRRATGVPRGPAARKRRKESARQCACHAPAHRARGAWRAPRRSKRVKTSASDRAAALIGENRKSAEANRHVFRNFRLFCIDEPGVSARFSAFLRALAQRAPRLWRARAHGAETPARGDFRGGRHRRVGSGAGGPAQRAEAGATDCSRRACSMMVAAACSGRRPS